jgi:hypothetical protein
VTPTPYRGVELAPGPENEGVARATCAWLWPVACLTDCFFLTGSWIIHIAFSIYAVFRTTVRLSIGNEDRRMMRMMLGSCGHPDPNCPVGGDLRVRSAWSDTAE